VGAAGHLPRLRLSNLIWQSNRTELLTYLKSTYWSAPLAAAAMAVLWRILSIKSLAGLVYQTKPPILIVPTTYNQENQQQMESAKPQGKSPIPDTRPAKNIKTLHRPPCRHWLLTRR
jgi:hypothetical protein